MLRRKVRRFVYDVVCVSPQYSQRLQLAQVKALIWSLIWSGVPASHNSALSSSMFREQGGGLVLSLVILPCM